MGGGELWQDLGAARGKIEAVAGGPVAMAPTTELPSRTASVSEGPVANALGRVMRTVAQRSRALWPRDPRLRRR